MGRRAFGFEPKGRVVGVQVPLRAPGSFDAAAGLTYHQTGGSNPPFPPRRGSLGRAPALQSRMSGVRVPHCLGCCVGTTHHNEKRFCGVPLRQPEVTAGDPVESKG
jgi:hypothetical protein